MHVPCDPCCDLSKHFNFAQALKFHVSSQMHAPMQAASNSVLLYPRRKGNCGQLPPKGRKPMALDLAALQDKFTLPQPDAARKLGVSLTSLKHVCRKLGLKRWPYRRHSEGDRARIANHKLRCTASVQGMMLEGESEGHVASGETCSYS